MDPSFFSLHKNIFQTYENKLWYFSSCNNINVLFLSFFFFLIIVELWRLQGIVSFHSGSWLARQFGGRSKACRSVFLIFVIYKPQFGRRSKRSLSKLNNKIFKLYKLNFVFQFLAAANLTFGNKEVLIIKYRFLNLIKYFHVFKVLHYWSTLK